MSGAPIDRRMFIGGVGAVAVTAIAPTDAMCAASGLSAAAIQEPSIYSVDDACGHWPPYSHPIPFGSPAHSDAFAHADAIDRIFLV